MANILIVDDEKKMRHLLSIMLSEKGYAVEQAPDGEAALEKLKSCFFDILITDIRMPKMDGLALLGKIRELKIPCPVIFITAFATVDSAVDAMRHGAVDYITKPFEEDRILLAVERTLNISRLMAENIELKQQLKKASGYGEIICKSKEMSALMEIGERVAKRNSTTVLLTGASGTGKEVMARFIHRTSSRSSNRFVPVNCAAISHNLVESELFGHEKGAFTSAVRQSVGKFEYADGGTLFLDEIGDLPFEAQSKLLRTLEDNTLHRVGGNREIQLDVRVICATNQDLKNLVEERKFRGDLFFRINGFPIHLPPLTDRFDDIIPLAEYFLRRFDETGRCALSGDGVNILVDYKWPGNVRELANVMERAVILAGDAGAITAETLSFLKPEKDSSPDKNRFVLKSSGISIEKVEKDLVRQALEMSGSNQTNAARLLGITRAKFRVLMKQMDR